MEVQFKEGDICIIVNSSYHNGALVNIVKVNEEASTGMFMGSFVNGNGESYKTGDVISLMNRKYQKLPLNNKLNRKLYPNYVEYKGYLVPKGTSRLVLEDKKGEE